MKKKAHNKTKEREVNEMKNDFLSRNKRNNINRPSRYNRSFNYIGYNKH